MKSKITIEVNFDDGQPYIRVIEDRESDDVRDKLIKFFRQRLGSTSSWCSVKFPQYNENVWEIHPIRPDMLPEQAAIINDQAALNQKFEEKQALSH